jgi:acyl phosphate:glycerol-3-phosphate acyltransferase
MFILVLVLSYLLGAIPFGVLISRHIYHVNIRELGSRNTGATNVWRVLGARAGATTLALDAIKGALGVVIARLVLPNEIGTHVAAGICAIVGHNWSVFLRGGGGKGVATSAGVFLALMPLHALIALGVFLIFFFSTRHVSVGSMAGAVALFVSTFFLRTPSLLRGLVALSAAMILIKHVPNMRRLARGEEPKVNF